LFKTGRHDIAEILLKVALNTKNQIKSNPTFRMYGAIFKTEKKKHFLCINMKSRHQILLKYYGNKGLNSDGQRFHKQPPLISNHSRQTKKRLIYSYVM
jgi:hypothetical protein